MAKLPIIITAIILLAAVSVGGYYFYTNQSTKASLPLNSGKPVTQEPASLTLELASPEDDSLLFQPDLVISGKTAPKTHVLISSETQDTVIEPKDDGSFSTVFTLAPGINNLQVAVFDQNGDQRSLSKTVYYSKEKI